MAPLLISMRRGCQLQSFASLFFQGFMPHKSSYLASLSQSTKRGRPDIDFRVSGRSQSGASPAPLCERPLTRGNWIAWIAENLWQNARPLLCWKQKPAWTTIRLPSQEGEPPSMAHPGTSALRHPVFSRRDVLQAGTLGLMGLSLAEVHALRAAAAARGANPPAARAVIYIFLSGGLCQHDSFDPKPDAPDNIRGEFAPIATRTPGIHICEHLPRLAPRSHLWALVRSLRHPTNDHSAGHHIMLTGRSDTAARVQPQPAAGRATGRRSPRSPAPGGAAQQPAARGRPAAVSCIHNTGRRHSRPVRRPDGAAARSLVHRGVAQFDPRLRRLSRTTSSTTRSGRTGTSAQPVFQAPNLSLPEGLAPARLGDRLRPAAPLVEQQQPRPGPAGRRVGRSIGYRQGAVSLLDLEPGAGGLRRGQRPSPRCWTRYGRNLFGWSLLMARRLVEAGVNLVQVNLGNNETWDTHGNAFPHLKDKLLPADGPLRVGPARRSARQRPAGLDADRHGRRVRPDAADLAAAAVLQACRAAITGGRCRRCFSPAAACAAARSSAPRTGSAAFPPTDPQTPENMAATIYQALGIARDGRVARRHRSTVPRVSRRPHCGVDGFDVNERCSGPRLPAPPDFCLIVPCAKWFSRFPQGHSLKTIGVLVRRSLTQPRFRK